MLVSSYIVIVFMVRVGTMLSQSRPLSGGPVADFLIQSGLAKQVRFHGKRYPWFVSDVTRKDWEWLLNTMVYGHLFPKATEAERESLRRLGARWKVRRFVSVDIWDAEDIRPAIRKRWQMGV